MTMWQVHSGIFILTVGFVRTDDNTADFLTKPLGAAKFYAIARHYHENEPTVGTNSLYDESADASTTSHHEHSCLLSKQCHQRSGPDRLRI